MTMTAVTEMRVPDLVSQARSRRGVNEPAEPFVNPKLSGIRQQSHLPFFGIGATVAEAA